VTAALNGTGVVLPGSYAACPLTIPRAMDIASKSGVVKKDRHRLKIKEDEARPDYSFDRWLQQAREFGDDVNKMVGHAKDEEGKQDKEAEEKKKEAEKNRDHSGHEDSEPEDKDAEDSETKRKKDEAWKQLHQIHRDRLKDFPKKDGESQSS
jgi:hypothetical protein